MIIREREHGLTLIRQTEHARLCGVMAEHWGASGFAEPEPYEPLVRAAAEHDNGWREWEDAPRINPDSGRPYTYIDIPIDQHLAIYRRGIARALVEDPYTGVMVSTHGSLLYSRFREGQPGASDFIAEQLSLRERLLPELADDPRYADHCDAGTLAANRDLLFGWDALSLFLCHGEAWLETLEFPTGSTPERVELAVRATDGGWSLEPWPFRQSLDLTISTIELDGERFEDQEALDRALKGARPGEIRTVISDQ